MIFPQTVEYALRAVVFLADTDRGSSTTRVIATETQIPAAYLSKVIQSLRRAGLVRCMRGIGGGVLLQRPLDQISVLDVVNAVEPFQRIRACPLGLPEHALKLCPLHASIDRALAELESRFRELTIADLVREGGLAIAAPAVAKGNRKTRKARA